MKTIDKDFKQLPKIQDLYTISFPKSERLPLWFLMWKSKKGSVEFIAFYEREEFVGFTYLITHQDLTFVLYLATSTEIRSKGYGTLILNKIKEMYSGNRIVLNIESVEGTGDDEKKIKRKKFYLKNGFRNARFTIIDREQKYEVLNIGGEVRIDEYKKLFEIFLGSFLYFFYQPKVGLTW